MGVFFGFGFLSFLLLVAMELETMSALHSRYPGPWRMQKR